jgi:hypothetical protein
MNEEEVTTVLRAAAMEHLTGEQMWDLALDTMPENEARLAEGHLRQCRICRSAYEQVTRPVEITPRDRELLRRAKEIVFQRQAAQAAILTFVHQAASRRALHAGTTDRVQIDEGLWCAEDEAPNGDLMLRVTAERADLAGQEIRVSCGEWSATARLRRVPRGEWGCSIRVPQAEREELGDAPRFEITPIQPVPTALPE